MKTLFLAMTGTVAIAAAAPAAAQYSQAYQQPYQQQYQGQYNSSANMDSRLARLDARIQAGVQSGAIDRREERSLRWQLNEINRLQAQYSRNGLTASETADLRQRLRTFRDQLAQAGGGGAGYGAYGTNGSGNNGYGNNGYGNGYANNGYNGRGGPYEDVVCDDTSRGGIGGLIDSIFGGGRSDDCAGYGVGVGARASSSWGAVPYQYRGQYRDGGSIYYRSDGRTIYGIDARTNTVVRVYPMNR
jgi:hypothetical protein